MILLVMTKVVLDITSKKKFLHWFWSTYYIILILKPL